MLFLIEINYYFILKCIVKINEYNNFLFYQTEYTEQTIL